jgi:hypothetical protein
MRVLLPFVSGRTESVGVVHLFFRLPKTSGVRILDLALSDPKGCEAVRKYVKADGKFAAFEGTPAAGERLQLELSVSAPVAADIRGACEIGGIGPYRLEIGAAGAQLRAGE